MFKKSSFIKLALLHSVLALPGCAAKEDEEKKDPPPSHGHGRSIFIFPIVTRYGPPRVVPPVTSTASTGVRPGGVVRTGSVQRSGFGRSGVGAS